MQICLNLDWKPQLQHTLKMIKEKGDHITNRAMTSGASPRQCLHLIQTCVKPAAAYTMVAAPYSEAEIGLMDQAIAAMTRKCCRLPKGFPGAGIHRPITEGGMGISSLMMEYTQITAATLTRALNDQEKLGCITRALLPIQSALLGDTKAGDLPHIATRYTSIMRQLQIMHKADIKIHKDEEDVTDTYMPMLTKLSEMGMGVQIPPRVLYSLH